MLKRQTFVSIFIIVVVSLTLTGILLTPETAFAQVATPAPAEEAAPTAAPAEGAAPAEAAPTPAPIEEAAPAEAAPTSAPAEEAAPAPTRLPTTGVASNPLAIILVVVGTVAVLGTLSGYSARRKRTIQE
jgi:LPXTG-motif cell wall-anchored protein